MPLQLIVDLDQMSTEQAEQTVAFILSYVSGAFGEQPDVNQIKPNAEPQPDPVKAFGAPEPPPGPTLVITPFPLTPTPLSPPPPPPAVPQTPAQPASAQVGVSVITDSSGLPWDGRIHASSKAVNKDGTWREKRGVAETLVANVTAELKRAMAAPGPQTPLPAPPAPGLQLVQAPASPPPPSPAAQAGKGDAMDQYVQLVGRSSAAVGKELITTDEVKRCLAAVGLESMPALGARLDLVPTVAQLIDGIIAGKTA